MRPIAFSINFDSFNHNFGFPKNFKDPTFFKIFDRFLAYSSKYNFKYSIYVIGRDLENPEICARVRQWARDGHEIGNHSYSHIQNLGVQDYGKIEYEILKSHELICICSGREPRGFICPAWATSKKVFKVLVENKYLYDLSVFPSLLLYPAVAKNALNHLRQPREALNILRRGYLYPLTAPLTPYFSDENGNKTSFDNQRKIIEMPLPTLSRFRGSIWHIIWFIFSRSFCERQLARYLASYDYFYYLMHPADLANENDIGKRKSTMQRMNVSLSKKRLYMDMVFEQIIESGRPIVTLNKLALSFLRESS